ncbi:MAG: sensor domain-containing diguanylate cyclase, partial [Candidatus Magnetoovum sp. WYHC-5]|nr:sensor domain-containing diguanylate cyclase [Candidatus Magnetoovum sp. WYHC-5]
MLMLMIINSRYKLQEIEQEISLKLKHTKVHVADTINSFISEKIYYLSKIGVSIADGLLASPNVLQERLEYLKFFDNGFNNMNIVNSSGVVVAAYPLINEKGYSNIGIDMSNSKVYNSIKERLKPVVYEHIGTPLIPTVTTGVPIIKDWGFVGYIFGDLDINIIVNELNTISKQLLVNISILNENNQMIISTRDNYTPFKDFNNYKGWESRRKPDDTNQLFPGKEDKQPTIKKWKSSVYMTANAVGLDNKWRIVVEVPFALYKDNLFIFYTVNFSLMLILIILSIMVSIIMKHIQLRPLYRLTEVTSNLPERLYTKESIKWPESLIVEFSALIENFKSMTECLTTKFQQLQHEISERKTVEDKLKQIAHFDTLTGLPNRRIFFDRLTQILHISRRNSTSFAILFMDLNRFKYVNDTLGHEYGDMLLKEVAKRLLTCIRQSDTVARLGGDEFTVLLAQVKQESDAAIVAEKIIKVIEQPFYLEGQECSIGVSIGISTYKSDSDAVDVLVQKADTAMY